MSILQSISIFFVSPFLYLNSTETLSPGFKPSLIPLIEINSETDFVSRNEQFQKFVSDCSKIAVTTNGDLKNLLKSKFINSDNTVEDELTKNVATIGENLQIRRIEKITLDGPGLIVSYVHNSVSENLGKIAVVLSLKSNADHNKLDDIGKKIAMHIAASNPISLDLDGLDPKIVDKEKQVLTEQTIASGKSKDIAEKICGIICLSESRAIQDPINKLKLKKCNQNISKKVSLEKTVYKPSKP